MSGVSADRIRELDNRISQLAMKTTDREPAALFMELSALGKRQNNWTKVGKIFAVLVSLVAFFWVDNLSFSGFPNEGVILALVAAVVLFPATMVGIMLLGKYAMRAQFADWARRAERVLQNHQSAPH